MTILTQKTRVKRQAKGKISRELRDIIHGYVMSDGYLTLNGNLQVEQGADQSNFVSWVYDKLAQLRTTSPIKDVKRYDKRTGKYTYSKRFYTKALLKGFRYIWYNHNISETGYNNSRKVLPKNIACFFSPTFIAVWFAGDGTKTIDSRGAKFEVTALTPEDRCVLKTLFKKKHDISVNITREGESKSGTEQWAITIPSGEYTKFRELITQLDLIQNCFSYKLHKK